MLHTQNICGSNSVYNNSILTSKNTSSHPSNTIGSVKEFTNNTHLKRKYENKSKKSNIDRFYTGNGQVFLSLMHHYEVNVDGTMIEE